MIYGHVCRWHIVCVRVCVCSNTMNFENEKFRITKLWISAAMIVTIWIWISHGHSQEHNQSLDNPNFVIGSNESESESEWEWESATVQRRFLVDTHDNIIQICPAMWFRFYNCCNFRPHPLSVRTACDRFRHEYLQHVCDWQNPYIVVQITVGVCWKYTEYWPILFNSFFIVWLY